jgi:hypothetical protein
LDQLTFHLDTAQMKALEALRDLLPSQTPANPGLDRFMMDNPPWTERHT